MIGFYIIGEKTHAIAHASMNNDTVRNLWRGFTFTESELEIEETDELVFLIGETDAPELPKNKEYAIRVNENGVAIRAQSHGALCRGLFDLLIQIEVNAACDGALTVAAMERTDSFTMKNRMIHFCIFPETDRKRFLKLIRLASTVGFTHAVIEFWGTYKYECFPEFAWDGAYTADEVRALVSEIRAFGMEPIPMINHLGHAASCRITGGKHVVLDRFPKLHRLFTPDGWCWNIFNPDALELLRKMRAELYELFGEGEYFHAGVDEAYMFAETPELRKTLAGYLADLTKEIRKEGRRPMIWMDMFLPEESGTRHLCKCDPQECADFLSAISPDSVLVDWQYETVERPLSTSKYLKEHTSIDIVTGPWHDHANIEACADTVTELHLFGMMMTTWHSMFKNTTSIVHAGRYLGSPVPIWSKTKSGELIRSETATLLRKLSFEGPNSYEDAGWVKSEILDTIGLYL